MYNIAICDDEVIFTQKISYILTQYVTENRIVINQKIYNDGGFLIEDIESGIFYDIYILDIEMPQSLGTDTAKMIRKYYSEAIIIFITSHMKYTLVSFEIGIFRYIPKGNLSVQLPLALKAAFYTLGCQEGECYMISNLKRTKKIFFKDIIYIYKNDKNSVFVTEADEINVRETLIEVYKKLSKDDFIQIDRCYIVNIRYINGVDGIEKSIMLRNNIKLNIPKNRVQELKQELSKFWEAGL